MKIRVSKGTKALFYSDSFVGNNLWELLFKHDIKLQLLNVANIYYIKNMNNLKYDLIPIKQYEFKML
jgi:hypothetical protein